MSTRSHLSAEAKILMIDDDIIHVDFLKTILRNEGYSVIRSVTNPLEAAAVFEEHQSDIIILDLNMPALGGFEVLRQLRRVIPPETYLPIIVVTADLSLAAREEALGSGASDFVIKPYNASEVMLRVRNLLATRFLHLQLAEQNELLERRVEERTTELRVANSALTVESVERERVQRAVERITDQWEQSFDAVPDHVCILDLQGTIIRANRTMRERFEPIHGPLQGLDYRLCYCGTATPESQPLCAEVFAKNRSVVWEGSVPALDGWYWIAAYPLSDNGTQWGAVSIVRDATARKEAEKALRQAQEELEERVRERTRELELANSALLAETRTSEQAEKAASFQAHILESINEAVIATDVRRRIIYVNQFAERLYGWPAGEMIGREITELLAPTPDPHQESEYMAAVKNGQPWSGELRSRRLDGTSILTLVSRSPFFEASGELAGFIGVSQDVTDLKKAEQAARFQAHILANIGEAVIATDPAGWIIYANQRAESLYGWSPEEMIGRDIVSLIAPQPSHEQSQSIMEAVRRGETWSGEFPVQHRDGSTFDAYVIDSSLYDERGELVAIIRISRDISERKRAEAALRESEERLRAFLNNAPWAVFMKDTEGRYQLVNNKWKELMGVTAEIAVGKKDSELGWPCNVAEQFAAQDRKVLGAGRVLEFEDVLSVPDGLRNFTTFKFPLWDTAGTLAAVCGIAVDITERKRAQEQLSRFFTLSLDLLTTLGLDGYFKEVNPAWEATLGWTGEELKSRPFVEFVHPDDREKTLAVAQGITEALELTNFENRYRCKDGTYKLFSWQARADLESQLIYATARDITPTRQVEMALRESEERFRSISDDVLDKAALGIIILDSSFRVAWANETIGVFFGAPRAELLGAVKPRAVHDWLKDIFAEPEVFASKVLATYENNTYIENFESHVLPAEGREERWLQHWSQPIESGLYAGGRVEFYTDISELKRAEQAVRVAMAEAHRANRAKSEFLSRMSHELRTPLNAILGFGQLLETEGRDAEEADNVHQVLKAGRHLLALVDEVLDVAGIEAGRVEFSLEPVEVREVVQETFSLVRSAAAARQVSLGEFENEVYVHADRQRLRQVLLNLVSNAVKYNREGGSVKVDAAETERGAMRITVRDTGRGIAPADVRKIFNPFERLDAAGTKIEGTGLGLAIATHLVQAMGGTLSVESERGQGSAFTVELPRAECVITSASKKDSTSVPERPKTAAANEARTVLYIEDNQANLTLVRRILARRPEWNLLGALTSAEGLVLAREQQPDLILLDLHLPGIGGDQVLEQLRADSRTRAIPVVMVSADAMPSEIERLKAAGALDYLTKPINVAVFLATVDRLMDEHAPEARS